MRPRDAATQRKIMALTQDNFPPDPDVWSILVSSDRVSLHPPAGNDGRFVTIPRKQFDAIVDWYNQDQTAEQAAE